MQAHEQIRAAPVCQRRTIGQIDIRILVARQNDIEPGLLELVAQFQRQRQCVRLFTVPERVVARVLAAVPRVEADGRDAFGVGKPGRNNSGRMAVLRSIWATSSAPWSAATGKDSATSVPLTSTMRESLSKTSRAVRLVATTSSPRLSQKHFKPFARAQSTSGA